MGNSEGAVHHGAAGALFCQQMMGAERGGEMIALIEKITGAHCPCKQGLVCPLAPAVQTSSTEVA